LAVLRVDDRGVGGSTGNFNEATAEDYASDAMASVSYLKTREEIDPESIGLVGHSEGGLIAPMVAVRSPDVAFIVLIASPGMAIKKMEYFEQESALKKNGAGEGLIAKNRAVQESLFDVIDQETDGDVVKKSFTSILTEFFRGLSEKERKIKGISEKALAAYIQNQFQRLNSPWFRYYLNYNPATVLRQVTCPVLAVNGEKDVQVTSKENLHAITRALEDGGNKDYSVKELPDLNHLLQTAQTGDISEYSKIEETMSAAAMEIIADWILDHLR
jgi:pimeloyl-ACP methyl ester carboxylesterase